MALLAPGWHGKRWKCNKGEHFSQPPQHMGFGGGYCDHVWGYSCRLLRWHAAQQLVFSLTSRHALLQLQYGKQWGVTLAESDRATLRYDVIESLRFEGLHQLQGTEQSLEGWIQVGWVSIAVELKALDMILWEKHEKTRFNSWNIIKPILKGPAFVAPPLLFPSFFFLPPISKQYEKPTVPFAYMSLPPIPGTVCWWSILRCRLLDLHRNQASDLRRMCELSKTRRSFDPGRLALGPWVREYRNNPNSSLDEATYQCLRHGSCGGKSAGGSVVTNKEVVRPLICPFRYECN